MQPATLAVGSINSRIKACAPEEEVESEILFGCEECVDVIYADEGAIFAAGSALLESGWVYGCIVIGI